VKRAFFSASGPGKFLSQVRIGAAISPPRLLINHVPRGLFLDCSFEHVSPEIPNGEVRIDAGFPFGFSLLFKF